MKLRLLSFGQLDQAETTLHQNYWCQASIFGSKLGINLIEIPALSASRARNETTRKRDEAKLVLGRVKNEPMTCFSEHGTDTSSTEFAALLDSWRTQGNDRYLVIGGAAGLDKQLLLNNRSLSFGRATWPHGLFRVMVAEQLWRAMSILAGHPYHRGS